MTNAVVTLSLDDIAALAVATGLAAGVMVGFTFWALGTLRDLVEAGYAWFRRRRQRASRAAAGSPRRSAETLAV